ncbi:MAG: hypothetical protein HY713_06535 [candidate division NC10 bacterium]|nr:hypothetical protein [candidate division NC10 bacterium]
MGLVMLAATPLHAAGPLRPIPAVVHAHTTWSSGDFTLDGLVARARVVGVDAIFLTENHLQRFEYGLPPLRNLLRYRVEYPSLMSQGPEPFLDAVRAANARQQDVVLIPGAEVIPHYYWTGNLFQGTLTMYNGQKNILVLGLNRPEDYRDLPVVGNANAAHWGLGSLWLLSPVTLAVPGVWLLRVRRRRLVRLQHVKFTVERRFTGCGVLCLTIGAALLANNFPFRTPPVSPYDSEAGLRPHQAVIDFVAARGGLAVWSMPEARDHQLVTVARMQATIHTDPYPSDLLRTDRFTAFGGVYEDTTTFTQPGGGWDRLLADYLSGRRAVPAWAIGEAAYHREGQAGKRFGDVQTVFLVDRKDPAALLEALRKGRFYALQRTPEIGLALDQFQVILPDHPAAEAGDRLALRAGDRPEVRAVIRATGERRIGIQTLLVRNGSVVHSGRGETPVTLQWSESDLPAETSLFYRLEVRGPGGHQILSNPIFVRTGRGGSP